MTNKQKNELYLLELPNVYKIYFAKPSEKCQWDGAAFSKLSLLCTVTFEAHKHEREEEENTTDYTMNAYLLFIS